MVCKWNCGLFDIHIQYRMWWIQPLAVLNKYNVSAFHQPASRRSWKIHSISIACLEKFTAVYRRIDVSREQIAPRKSLYVVLVRANCNCDRIIPHSSNSLYIIKKQWISLPSVSQLLMGDIGFRKWFKRKQNQLSSDWKSVMLQKAFAVLHVKLTNVNICSSKTIRWISSNVYYTDCAIGMVI